MVELLLAATFITSMFSTVAAMVPSSFQNQALVILQAAFPDLGCESHLANAIVRLVATAEFVRNVAPDKLFDMVEFFAGVGAVWSSFKERDCRCVKFDIAYSRSHDLLCPLGFAIQMFAVP